MNLSVNMLFENRYILGVNKSKARLQNRILVPLRSSFSKFSTCTPVLFSMGVPPGEGADLNKWVLCCNCQLSFRFSQNCVTNRTTSTFPLTWNVLRHKDEDICGLLKGCLKTGFRVKICYENAFRLEVHFYANQLIFTRKVLHEYPFWNKGTR